ncbi:MAG: hypothetical protein RBQ87_01240 [Candidatus Cloacimonadaceae bacterium]|jgi:hypothetical protein|nr:hypothetical protein [Candidatus Cloacimonadaceae bacterium]
MGYGDTPYMQRGGQIDRREIFGPCNLEAVLQIPVTIPPGFGYIPAGAVMGQITSETGATRASQYVPYTPQDAAGGLAAALTTLFGAAYLLADPGATATTLDVTLNDSYKFAVGDHIAAIDSDTVAIDCGAISAIDRTTYANKAVITIAETDLSAVDSANGGCLIHQTQLTTPFQNAVGILVGGVETGIGSKAKGAQGVIVISNAILNSGALYNLDSGAITDLGAVSSGNWLILK